jgi:Peptidase family S41
MKQFFTLLFITLNLNAIAQEITETRIFQPAALQQDFNYLRKALEETHPGLYKHHTKEAMQYKMDSLYSLLNKPMPFLDFYKIIAYLIAEVKCEHTYCNPYSDNRMLQWKLIPIQLLFWQDKAYVIVNRTADTSIHLGDELLSINHYPADSIKHVIYKYMSSDGDMESSKEITLSSLAFNINYHIFIEQPEVFEMKFKNSDGQEYYRRFDKSLTIQESNKLALANPANNEVIAFEKRSQKYRKNSLRLEIEKERNIAFLHIQDFGGDREKVFKKYNDFFTKLKNENIGNLVVVLENNGGGEEEYACELLSYFIKTPTRFIENEYLINIDTGYLKISNAPKDAVKNIKAFIDTVIEGKYYVKEQLAGYTMELRMFQPKPNSFHGDVYFLVNGGTSSAASTCAANAKSHRLATIVGDETAGSFAGGGTVNGLDLTLPNSKITAHTSIVYCTFSTTGADANRGVIPDIYFKRSFADIVKQLKTEPDLWKEFFYRLIKNGK